jgi:hypothetical protein
MSSEPAPKARKSSPRSRLGRIALEAAKALPQVADGVAGAQKLWATEDEGEILTGVIVAARRDARFDVELHLVAQWPIESLFALGDEVRDRVRRAAKKAELDSILGDVIVAFEDLRDPSASDATGS